MISAAKDRNIEIIELQHGNMSRFHMGYSFPNSKNVPYFPDKMLLFGKFWFDSTPLPLDKSNVKIIGFKDFNNKIKQYINVPKIPNSVVFISQGIIGGDLSKKAVETAKNNAKYSIIYRLHPQERNRWESIYPDLAENSRLENLVVDAGDSTIYDLLSKSEYVVGVSSTALYEALAFGCKVALLNLFSIEYMNYLINKGYVKKINIEEDIDFATLDRLKKVQKDYFFGEEKV